MTTAAHFRKTALSLPEATEEGAGVYVVGGRRFAALVDGRAELHLPAADATELTAAQDGAERSGSVVRVPLAGIDGQALNHWVRRAWRARAPKRLADAAAAADTARPGEVGDLPRAIGRPATQALVNAGITTLAQVAALGDAELSALHGVGPKAVRLLRAALDRS